MAIDTDIVTLLEKDTAPPGFPYFIHTKAAALWTLQDHGSDSFLGTVEGKKMGHWGSGQIMCPTRFYGKSSRQQVMDTWTFNMGSKVEKKQEGMPDETQDQAEGQ
ncbi:hypothetical protein LG302_11435 [Halomonas organivorans]